MFSEIQFFFESCWSTACSASIARWLACDDAGGNSPTVRSNSSRLSFRASSTLLPRTNSVSAEPHAIAATQPLARKRISAIRPSAIFIVSSRMSPHAGFSMRAEASASAIVPRCAGVQNDREPGLNTCALPVTTDFNFTLSDRVIS